MESWWDTMRHFPGKPIRIEMKDEKAFKEALLKLLREKCNEMKQNIYELERERFEAED